MICYSILKMDFLVIDELFLASNISKEELEELYHYTRNEDTSKLDFRTYAETSEYSVTAPCNGEDVWNRFMNPKKINWFSNGDNIVCIDKSDKHAVSTLRFLLDNFFDQHNIEVDGNIILINTHLKRVYFYYVNDSKIYYNRNASDEYTLLWKAYANIFNVTSIHDLPEPLGRILIDNFPNNTLEEARKTYIERRLSIFRSLRMYL